MNPLNSFPANSPMHQTLGHHLTNIMTERQTALWLDQKQAEFLHNAVCGVPDDQREDGDEETLEYLLSELNSILCRFEPD